MQAGLKHPTPTLPDAMQALAAAEALTHRSVS